MDVARAEQPESGGSVVVSLLIIEPTWLGSVYNGHLLATDKIMANLLSFAGGNSQKHCICQIHGLELAYRVLDNGHL